LISGAIVNAYPIIYLKTKKGVSLLSAAGAEFEPNAKERGNEFLSRTGLN
jgi:hypothetical protein